MAVPDEAIVQLLTLVERRTREHIVTWEQIGPDTFQALGVTGSKMILCDHARPSLPWFASDDGDGTEMVVLARGEMGVLRALGLVVRVSARRFVTSADAMIDEIEQFLSNPEGPHADL